MAGAGGLVVIPENASLLDSDAFRRGLLADPGSAAPSLGYGEPAARNGLHIMETPTAHGVATLTRLGAPGVEVRPPHPAAPPLPGRPPHPPPHLGARDAPPLLWLTLLVIAQNLFAVAIFPLMPVYADEVLDIGPGGFGLMGGVFGAGLLAGAAVVAVVGIHHRHAFVMLAAGVVWDGAMISFAFSRSVPLTLGFLFVMGLAGMPWVTACLTMFPHAGPMERAGGVRARSVRGVKMGWVSRAASTMGSSTAAEPGLRRVRRSRRPSFSASPSSTSI